MRPFTTPAVGAVAISDPVKVDYIQMDFNIGLSLNVVSGTNTSSVQYSLDDPDADYATDYNTDATWYDVPGLDAKTANTSVALIIPCRAVRLNMTAFTSGSATLTIVQAHR